MKSALNTRNLIVFILLPLIFSCSRRNLGYFSNYGDEKLLTEDITLKPKQPIIQPGDLLQISVTDANPAAAAPFNRISSNTASSNAATTSSQEGYLVDENGIIDFPILGRIKIGGQTKAEAKLSLTNLLTNYLGNPMVSIRYLNYRITVLGEVRSPNTFLVPSERINLIEALGLAGDLTIYGKRENIKIINEANGVRTIAQLDLNDKTILDSPYFYLQPNDIVYVEPVTARKDQSSLTRSNISLALAIISAASLVLINFR
ncbi:polysaccharide biosynthesis/export family protein [Maribacter dokdonensis]|uniref:polysaccharide biosynthesis/export family protein n=1 Tax=Maribacter dokdonensis TaxID=320912 RepID=UPI0027340C62|nr:polysaccharide biosynthesis/export family protein [Maribacter dokdonensis]MDP2525768.1 polysaccharide biosynthesis/export family protein [Maribacter dokdonensis]